MEKVKNLDKLNIREHNINNNITYTIFVRDGFFQKELWVNILPMEGGTQRNLCVYSDIEPLIESLNEPIKILNSSMLTNVLLKTRVLDSMFTTWIRRFSGDKEYTRNEFAKKYPQYFI